MNSCIYINRLHYKIYSEKKIVCFCYKVTSIFNPKSMNFVAAVRNSIIKMIYSMINMSLY